MCQLMVPRTSKFCGILSSSLMWLIYSNKTISIIYQAGILTAANESLSAPASPLSHLSLSELREIFILLSLRRSDVLCCWWSVICYQGRVERGVIKLCIIIIYNAVLYENNSHNIRIIQTNCQIILNKY